MFLAVDVGNTQITFGLFKDGKLEQVFGTIYPKNIMQYGIELIISTMLRDIHVNHCIISSVVDELTQKIQNAILNVLHVHALILSTDLELGIKIQSRSPESAGTDRIANVSAAAKLYRKRPIIVVDSGSATTFDILNEENIFIGGLILPGLNMQLKALHSNTSKLPELTLDSMDKVKTIINNDTKKSILAGVVQGHAQAIQGLITKCEKELKTKAFVVGTGGDAQLLSKYMKYRKFNKLNPFLTLEGIYTIYQLNNK